MDKRGVVVSLVMSLGLPLAAPICAQNWPGFRGANGSGVSSGKAPTHWNTEEGTNVAWKTPIPGLGHSSPIVWGDRVYVTTAVALDPKADQTPSASDQMIFANDLVKHSWRLYALDRRSGKIVWQASAGESAPRGRRVLKSSYANPTPVTDGQSIVAAFADGTLACFDRDGKLRWRREFGVPSFANADQGLNDITSSPILYKNLVIHLHDHKPESYVAAYDLQNGKEVWKVAREDDNTFSTPAVVSAGGKAVLVTNSWRWVRGHDPLTGQELWRMRARKGAWDRGPVPLQAGNLIVVAGGGPDQSIYAIRPTATGELGNAADQPLDSHIAWTTAPGSPYIPTPVVVGNRLYSLTDKGILSVFDTRDGRRIYQQRVAPEASAFCASPVATGSRLYLASEDGDIFVVGTGDNFELLATNPMGEITFATPAVAGDMLIVRTASHVYGIAESNKAQARR